jgi:DNA polymerase elongation subunit (family B)
MNKQERELKIIELKAKISKLNQEVDYYNSLQLAFKLVLNGSYGAFATKYFILFNNHVAGTITAEGRKLTETMSLDNQDYWYNQWHLDTDLHKEMFIKDVEEIPVGTVVSVYGDSVTGDSILKTSDGNMTIEELYNICSKKSNRIDKEVVECNSSSLNWTSEKGVHLSKIKNVIKHKVSKKMWKIKVGGNELRLTNDHSLIVFRNDIKIKVKPSEVRGTDKVLIYKEKTLYGDTDTTE